MTAHENSHQDTEQTDIEQPESEPIDTLETTVGTRFDDVPGLDDEKAQLDAVVVQSMLSTQPVRANTTVLYGRDGSGAVALGDALAGELDTHGFRVFRLALAEKPYLNDGELAHYIEEAQSAEPCVLRVENIGAADLTPGAPATTAIEQINAAGSQVALVGTATFPVHSGSDISESFLRTYADIVLGITEPGEERRRAILQDALDTHCDETAVDFEPAAVETQAALDTIPAGSVDVLRTVGKRAVIRALTDPDATALQTAHLTAAAENVAAELGADAADRTVSEAEIDELMPSIPDVTFDDVGGLPDVKARIQELLVYPRKYADLFERAGVSPTHGLVLYGPPGTGKTLLAKAIANATDRTFIAVKGPELKCMWYGGTEQQVREVFELADEHAPSVVFFDEFDALAGNRNEFTHEVNASVVATLLAELDGLENRDDVLFLAATNRPDALDPAVIRSGRFGEVVEVPLPDEEGCREIFSIHAADLPLAESVTPRWVAAQLPEGVSGADIAAICERSLYEAIGDADADTGADQVQITRAHISAAITAHTGTDSQDSRPSAFN